MVLIAPRKVKFGLDTLAIMEPMHLCVRLVPNGSVLLNVTHVLTIMSRSVSEVNQHSVGKDCGVDVHCNLVIQWKAIVVWL